MSIFPRRAARGSVITLHVRRQLAPEADAGWVFVDVRTRGPSGRVVTHARHFRVLPSLGIDAASEQGSRLRFAPVSLAFEAEFPPRVDETTARAARASTEGTELERQEAFRELVAAYEQPKARRTLARMLTRLQLSAHYYYCVPVTADAELGRHGVAGSLTDARTGDAVALPDDCFFVDALSLRREWTDEHGFHAEVDNPGPEPVPALLLRLGDGDARGHVVEVPAGGHATFDGGRPPLLLAYAEGARHVIATGDGSPLVTRSPQWSMERPAEGPESPLRLRARGEAATASPAEHVLTGAAARAFVQANGTQSRLQLEQAFPGGEARALLEQGLLVEIALDADAREPGEPREEATP